MNKILLASTALLASLAAACVTINVYFPEAAAEQAADRIIDKVRGETSEDGVSLDRLDRTTYREPLLVAASRQYTRLFLADAHAQGSVDFDKPSAEKTALENSLTNRFPQLKPYFDSGAVGLGDNGLVEIRDRNLVPLKDRNNVLQLVAAQNNDWNALYTEIARLNNHPEWVDSIRRTFAERWVAKADAGWWYKDGGSWKQK